MKSRAISSSRQHRPICGLRKYAMLHALKLSKILEQGLLSEVEREVSKIEKSIDSAQLAFSLQLGVTN